MDEGDMFWKWPARSQRVETAHRRVRRATPPSQVDFDHADECPDATRFRQAVFSLIGGQRYTNLIHPLAVRVDGCTVRLFGSPILLDCLEPHAPALGSAAVQVLGEDASCTFATVPHRRAA